MKIPTELPIKKGSTLFLKLVIILMGLGILAIITIPIPMEIAKGGMDEFFIFWVLLYAAAIPFYIALYQGMKLLGYIDKNTAFSQASVTALRYIQYCAMTMTVLYIACLPWIVKIAESDDAPGVILIWTAFSGGPMVIAVFSSLLQLLLQNVLDIKSENDLTV